MEKAMIITETVMITPAYDNHVREITAVMGVTVTAHDFTPYDIRRWECEVYRLGKQPDCDITVYSLISYCTHRTVTDHRFKVSQITV